MKAYFAEQAQRLAQLEKKFGEIEQSSLAISVAELGKYLCFRLDGIKTSKRFLKDALINETFNNAFRDSVEAVYYLLRKCTGEEHGQHEEGNFFLCAFSTSDEVSFVLNNQRNHLGNRIFKTGSSLAGMLSGSLSMRFKSESVKKGRPTAAGKQYPQVMAFDARPLVLDDYDEVERYIIFRWLVACRNTMCKVLRLAKVMSGDELYQLGVKNNMKLVSELLEEHHLEEQYHAAMREFTLYTPKRLTHDGLLEMYSPGDGMDGILSLCAHLRALRGQSESSGARETE